MATDPVRNIVSREFVDASDLPQKHISDVYNFKPANRRGRYMDGDWEELDDREVDNKKKKPGHPDRRPSVQVRKTQGPCPLEGAFS